jgi:hypothetical protein
LYKWIVWTTVLSLGMFIFINTPLQDSAPITAAMEAAAAPELVSTAAVLPRLEASASPTAAQQAPLPIQQKSSVKDESFSLETSIDQWKQKLSKEKGFESWEQATWSTYPLGPGTHGWIVLLQDDGLEVGYMVIHSTEDGALQLTEYGTGTHPLFSLNTLYRTLVQQELIPLSMTLADLTLNGQISIERWYQGGLAALWILTLDEEKLHIDAKTGEILPIDQVSESPLDPLTIHGTRLIGLAEQQLFPAFDPYERLPWVMGEPLPITQYLELKELLQGSINLTYVAELYKEHTPVTVPLAVIGYQQWDNEEPFVILEQQGERYMPLTAVLAQGQFYE